MAALTRPIQGSVYCRNCDTTLQFQHHDSTGLKEAQTQLLALHQTHICPARL